MRNLTITLDGYTFIIDGRGVLDIRLGDSNGERVGGISGPFNVWLHRALRFDGRGVRGDITHLQDGQRHNVGSVRTAHLGALDILKAEWKRRQDASRDEAWTNMTRDEQEGFILKFGDMLPASKLEALRSSMA